jgi:hypothetical protein
MLAEGGHVRGDEVRVLRAKARREQRRCRPQPAVARRVRDDRPNRGRCAARRRKARRRAARPAADEHEALHAGRHPDRELKRDRRSHRQPDDVRALESAVIEDARRVGGEQRRRDGSAPDRGATGPAMVVGDHADIRQVMVSDRVEDR